MSHPLSLGCQPSQVDELILTAVRCCIHQSDPAQVVDRLEALSESGVRQLLQRADAEGVSGILAEVLAEHESRPSSRRGANGTLAAELRSRHHLIFAHSARTLEMLKRIGDAFARAGLRAIVLKGAALLADLYRGHLGRRPVSDLDLVVRRRELAAVEEVLRRLGLRPLATRWRGDGIEIDLHTHLVRSELIGHRRTAYKFTREHVWESSIPCSIGGPAMRVLPPDLQILHLAVHAVKHAFGRWIWCVDLALLLAEANPANLLASASAVQADRALAYTALLLGHGLGVKTPLEEARALPELNHIEIEWLRLVAARNRPMGLGRTVAGFSIPGAADRLAYWGEIVFPSAQVLHQTAHRGTDLRAFLRWLTRVGQVFRLAGRSTGLLRP